MRRLIQCCAAALVLGMVDCSGARETTEWCDDSCKIWHECTGWDFEACVSECRADGDWDADYLACIRQQSCTSLSACE
jgi:hypothetical protein